MWTAPLVNLGLLFRTYDVREARMRAMVATETVGDLCVRLSTYTTRRIANRRKQATTSLLRYDEHPAGNSENNVNVQD